MLDPYWIWILRLNILKLTKETISWSDVNHYSTSLTLNWGWKLFNWTLCSWEECCHSWINKKHDLVLETFWLFKADVVSRSIVKNVIHWVSYLPTFYEVHNDNALDMLEQTLSSSQHYFTIRHFLIIWIKK